MRHVRLITCLSAVGVLVGAGMAFAVNSVVVESKTVLAGTGAVTVGIYLTNDIILTVLLLPMEVRTLTGTAFWNSIDVNQPDVPAANRAGSSNLIIGASVEKIRYPVPSLAHCSGPLSNSYQVSGQLDFVTPDCISLSAISLATDFPFGMAPGTDPAGTANASVTLTFGVGAGLGEFIIDTCCAWPSSHLAYADVSSSIYVPSFTQGVITIVSPHLLSMQVLPVGSGSVTPVSGPYVPGVSVPIQATANPGYTFSGWTGSGAGSYSGSNNPASVTMSADITQTAYFSSDDSYWSAVSGGMDGTVYSLAVFNSQLIVGGYFTFAGGQAANYIAAWNGSSWSTLGTGMDSPVRALTVFNSQLIAGGHFTTAGGQAANKIAAWNGLSWSALGTGLDTDPFHIVYVLTVFNNQLIAGGNFLNAGGTPANFIAAWNSSSWSALGTGMDGAVEALTVYNSQLIAGGFFSTAGGAPANYIAAWNGSSWSALGPGMNSAVRALTVFNSQLIAGGDFSTAGGQTADRIAAWNGSSWSPLGTGLSNLGSVEALAVFNSQLIAGGGFTAAGGTAANDIAAWDGLSWSPLGSGLGGTGSHYVYALAPYGGKLYVGGDFSTAGGKASSNIAAWTKVDCDCHCHADPHCEGVTDVLDVVGVINVAFRGVAEQVDAACPKSREDMDCGGFVDVLDVVKMVNVAFRGADPATQFCDACP